jgi:hypothetical protein
VRQLDDLKSSREGAGMCGTSTHLVLLRTSTSDIGLDDGSMKFLGYRELLF